MDVVEALPSTVPWETLVVRAADAAGGVLTTVDVPTAALPWATRRHANAPSEPCAGGRT